MADQPTNNSTTGTALMDDSGGVWPMSVRDIWTKTASLPPTTKLKVRDDQGGWHDTQVNQLRLGLMPAVYPELQSAGVPEASTFSKVFSGIKSQLPDVTSLLPQNWAEAIEPDLGIGRKLVTGAVGGSDQQLQQALGAAKTGNWSQAVSHALASSLPVIGPAAMSAADQFAGDPNAAPGSPEAGPSIARGLGATGTLVGPMLAGLAPESVTGLPVKAVSRVLAIDPIQGMIQALRAGQNNLRFQSDLSRSLPELHYAEAIEGKPIQNLADLKRVVTAAKDRIWQQYQRVGGLDREHTHIDMSPVADQMNQSIPEVEKFVDPAGTAARVQANDVWRTTMPLSRAEDMLRETNAQLQGHYAKLPYAQRAALEADPVVSGLEARADALRNAIYQNLDREGGGEIPRELKQRYGSLMNLEREVDRRWNVYARQMPNNLTQTLSKIDAVKNVMRGAIKLGTGQLSGVADIAGALTEPMVANTIKDLQGTNGLIRRSLASVKEFPAPLDMTRTFKPAALLTTGDMIPPAPADTSYVRSTGPDFGQQVTRERKLLAPGPAPYTQGVIVPDIKGRPQSIRLLDRPTPGHAPENVLQSTAGVNTRQLTQATGEPRTPIQLPKANPMQDLMDFIASWARPSR